LLDPDPDADNLQNLISSLSKDTFLVICDDDPIISL